MKRMAVFLCLLLSSCAVYEWEEKDKVETATIHKVVIPNAKPVCNTLLGDDKVIACVIRIVINSVSRCVVFTPNEEIYIQQHEFLHCFGYDHK